MKKSEIIFGVLRIPLDFLMVVLAFLLAYKARTYPDLIPGMYFPVDLFTFPPLPEYLLKFVLPGSAVLLIIFALNRMYSLKITAKLGRELPKVIFLTGAWLMLIIAYFFVTRQFFFSRLVLGYSLILTMVLVSTGRILIKIIQDLFAKIGIGKRRVLLIGANILSRKISETLFSNPHYQIVGYLASKISNQLEDLNFLGPISELNSVIKKLPVEEIIQTQSNLTEAQAADILGFCREHHLQYHFVPDLLQVQRTNIEVSNLSGIPLITLKPTPLDGWGKVFKRGFDSVVSSIGLIIFSPLFALTAILIKLDSKGTVFFKYLDDGSRVKRVGQYGKLFHFLKFRTMYPGTHNLRYTLLASQNVRKGSPLVKIKNDPRITRIGRFLRKTSLDELPQLFNVLKGEMSLVGPRPHLPEEVAKYQKHHKFVLTLKPGITGLAQIGGRSNLDFEEEVRLDTYYIENWSPFLDLKILFKTIWAVLKGKGAE